MGGELDILFRGRGRIMALATEPEAVWWGSRRTSVGRSHHRQLEKYGRSSARLRLFCALHMHCISGDVIPGVR